MLLGGHGQKCGGPDVEVIEFGLAEDLLVGVARARSAGSSGLVFPRRCSPRCWRCTGRCDVEARPRPARAAIRRTRPGGARERAARPQSPPQPSGPHGPAHCGTHPLPVLVTAPPPAPDPPTPAAPAPPTPARRRRPRPGPPVPPRRRTADARGAARARAARTSRAAAVVWPAPVEPPRRRSSIHVAGRGAGRAQGERREEEHERTSGEAHPPRISENARARVARLPAGGNRGGLHRVRPPVPLDQRLFHLVGRARGALLLRGFERDAREARRVNAAALRRILLANQACQIGRRLGSRARAGSGRVPPGGAPPALGRRGPGRRSHGAG